MSQWADLQPGITWHGGVDDFVRLLACVNVHCTCRAPAQPSVSARPCGSHGLLTEQHTLDHFVFARGMRQQLVDSEWLLDTPDARRHAATGTLGQRSVGQHRMRDTQGSVMAVACAALLLLLSAGGPWLPPVNTAPQLASWQSR